MPNFDYASLSDGEGSTARISDIDPFPSGNIRKKRDPVKFQELRDAIKVAKGVTQGVTVRLNPNDSTRLELLAGYGRFEASDLEGFDTIPIVFKIVNDREAKAIMISENLDREELHIVDEASAAQDFISLYNGDEVSAAQHLGWSMTKFKGRLVLNTCSDSVLDALRDNKIQIGHAEILSAYTHKLQDGTLKKIIDEEWSLDYLKERAGKATRWLKPAIFDKTDCAACPHNSDIQASLFENTIGKAKCSNLTCFKQKTDVVLEQIKTTLSESHSLVLLKIEKPEADRNTISVDVVGKEQFESGCTGCISNAVILTDGINQDAGDVIHNQCVDTDCFRKMVKAKQDAELKAEEANTLNKADKGKNENAQTGKTTTTKKAAAKTTQQTPPNVIHQSKLVLHRLSVDHFINNSHFKEALTVAALATKISNTRLSSIKQVWDAPLTLQDQVMGLFALSSEQLSEVKQQVYGLYIFETGESTTEPSKLMIHAFSQEQEKHEIALAGWKPTEDILKAYLSASLVMMAEKSGFKTHYDSEHGKGTFGKVAKRKGDLIKAMLNSSFDWSDYAPLDYLSLLNNNQ